MFVPELWNEREEYINNDYTVTAWILCIIPFIREYIFKNPDGKHHIQVNNAIKTLYSG